jgi:nitrite reductase/ring-hydroxylating ferredoxin subunit
MLVLGHISGLGARGRRVPRRRFFQAIGALVAAPFVAGLFSLTDRLARLRSGPRRIVLPAAGQTQDVVFVDEIVVCRTAAGVRVLSARCTHLGCQISQQADGLLVCPCHGSRFRLDGSVARGPAGRPLEILRHSTDPATGAITVTVA